MMIKVLEEEKDKIKIDIDDLTFATVLNEYLWKDSKIDYAGAYQEHPYMVNPIVVVKSKNPSKSLTDAAELVLKDVQSLIKQAQKS